MALVVGAIEIGTTFSGWAFSSVHEFKYDPTKITTSLWFAPRIMTSKTPTSALISPDGKTLMAFGYEAEHKHCSLTEKDERDYYYFRRFAKAFNDKTFSRSLEIKDKMGKKMKAVDVFSLYIAALKETVINAINKFVNGDISCDDMYWVLTVPATLGDVGKQFMREAATKAPASIRTGSLSIVSEAEAASMYCHYLSKEHVVNAKQFIAKLQTGTKYMILDAGGETMDITIYEVQADGGDMQVFTTTEDVGGILVEEAFENLLFEILGKEVYHKFIKMEPEDWMYMWRIFEVKKGDCLKDFKIMRLPTTLIDYYKSETNKDLRERIAETKYGRDIKLDKDKLRFNDDMMKHLFSEYILKVDTNIRSTLHLVSGTEVIYMVGGMGSTPSVQDAMKKAFPNLNIIIPNEASTAVMQGAVIRGHVMLGTKTSVTYNGHEGTLHCCNSNNCNSQDLSLGPEHKHTCLNAIRDPVAWKGEPEWCAREDMLCLRERISHVMGPGSGQEEMIEEALSCDSANVCAIQNLTRASHACKIILDDVNYFADSTEMIEPVLQPLLGGRIQKVKTRIADRDEPEQEDTKYKSIYPKRGKAIIINNKNFSCGLPREGTDIDAESLEKLFTDIGFEAIRYDDLDSKDMHSKLEAVSKSGDLSESNMFVCAILTHGKEGAVSGTDRVCVRIKDLLEPFNGTNCKALVGKPKMFFIQACQGPKKDTGVQPDGNGDDGKDIDQDKLLNWIPIEADFFIAYSTFPGYVSWRYEEDGTWFIQALCKVLEAHWESLDLCKIMTRVNKEVAKKREDFEENRKVIKVMQMPCFVSTLREEVQFK